MRTSLAGAGPPAGAVSRGGVENRPGQVLLGFIYFFLLYGEGKQQVCNVGARFISPSARKKLEICETKKYKHNRKAAFQRKCPNLEQYKAFNCPHVLCFEW